MPLMGKMQANVFLLTRGPKVSDNDLNLIGLFRTLYSGILRNVVIQYQ